jgi:hypothetical protein
MVKLIQCVRRKRDVPVAEFRRLWSEYGSRLRAGALAIGAGRCTLSTALLIGENLQIVLNRGTVAPFDGVAEIWFDDAPSAMARLKSPEGQSALGDFQAFQESFIDLGESCFFFAGDEVLAG